MAEKKFILFIVEGLNDKKEIESILHTPFFSECMQKYKPYVKPVNGDITADKNSSENNIKDKVGQIVRDFRKRGVPYSNIKVSDIYKLVHIVDTDGVFISRTDIVKTDDVSFVYEDECIKSSNPDVVFGRNRKKANILRVLKDVNQIDNIPYELYFVSCNMDHMLFGRINIQSQMKKALADAYVIECKNNPDCIFNSVFNEGISYKCTYEESWREIQIGTNSLKRHTNINLFFSSVINEGVLQ